MAITLSDAYKQWLAVHGMAEDSALKAIDSAVAEFPDLAGQAAGFKAKLAEGFKAAGASDPVSALAFAERALGEILSGKAGVDPNAFGGAGG